MILTATAVFLAGALAAWALLGLGLRGFHAYHRLFSQLTHQRMSEFFLYVDPAQLWGITWLCAAVAGIALALLSGYWWLGVGLGVLMVFVPQFALMRWRRLRLERIEAQLPEFLMALSGALHSGASLQAALRQVGERVPAPLGQEIALMQREQRLGMSFRECLDSFQVRLHSEGVELMVSALRIAHQSGGSLGPLLEEIATTLRLRLQLLGRIRALTSQGRMQAWVMAALPPLLAAVLGWLDPQAMGQLWATPLGWAVVVLIVVLEASGIWLIRRIVAIAV